MFTSLCTLMTYYGPIKLTSLDIMLAFVSNLKCFLLYSSHRNHSLARNILNSTHWVIKDEFPRHERSYILDFEEENTAMIVGWNEMTCNLPPRGDHVSKQNCMYCMYYACCHLFEPPDLMLLIVSVYKVTLNKSWDKYFIGSKVKQNYPSKAS